MPDKQPVSEKNLDIYGHDALPWSRALEQLQHDKGINPTHWLATVNPDGRPHVMAVWAVWLDGTFYFLSGAKTRKGKNLARSPHCVITVASTGIDLVLEGDALKVTDEARLRRIAEEYAAQGWHPTVRDGAFYADYGAPSAGEPPWDVYELSLMTAFGVGREEPNGATRWRF